MFKVYIKRAKVTNGDVSQSNNVTENPVLGEESLLATSKKRSPVIYCNGPRGKIRKINLVKVDCGNILSELMNHSFGRIFSEPVDPVKLKIPDYFSIISSPMDLGTIKRKLEENAYSNMDKFADDVRLTFDNAMLYNPSNHKVYEWANNLSGLFDKKWKSLEAKLKNTGSSSCNDDSQDSSQSDRESFQDSEREMQIGVDSRVNHIRMVKNQSTTEQKAKEKDTPDKTFSSDLSRGRSSERNLFGDSEMNDGLNLGTKKGRDDEVVPEGKKKHNVNNESPRRSTKTHCSDDGVSILNLHNSSNDVHPVHNSSNGVHPVSSSNIENSESALSFKDIKSFENFVIQVNGETLNSEIPEDFVRNYYQLCCTQQRFLHDSVNDGCTSNLVTVMIQEIVSIAESMKDADILPVEKLESMRKTLKFLESSGMIVAFLLVTIEKHMRISREYQTLEESMRKKKAEVGSLRTACDEKQLKIDCLRESLLTDENKIEQMENELKQMEVEASTLKDQREKLGFALNEVSP